MLKETGSESSAWYRIVLGVCSRHKSRILDVQLIVENNITCSSNITFPD